MGEVLDLAGDLLVINLVPPRSKAADRAMLDVIVKLHHFRLAMGLCRTEAKSAKISGKIRRVIFREFGLGQDPVVHKPFEREHSHYVGFSFFQAAINWPNGLADIDLFTGSIMRESWTE